MNMYKKYWLTNRQRMIKHRNIWNSVNLTGALFHIILSVPMNASHSRHYVLIKVPCGLNISLGSAIYHYPGYNTICFYVAEHVIIYIMFGRLSCISFTIYWHAACHIEVETTSSLLGVLHDSVYIFLIKYYWNQSQKIRWTKTHSWIG